MPKSKFSIQVTCRGLKQAGIRAFDEWMSLYISLAQYSYKIGLNDIRNEEDVWLEKLYHEMPIAEEINNLIERWIEYWIDRITNRVVQLKTQNK